MTSPKNLGLDSVPRPLDGPVEWTGVSPVPQRPQPRASVLLTMEGAAMIRVVAPQAAQGDPVQVVRCSPESLRELHAATTVAIAKLDADAAYEQQREAYRDLLEGGA